jgi:hypothetical protein
MPGAHAVTLGALAQCKGVLGATPDVRPRSRYELAGVRCAPVEKGLEDAESPRRHPPGSSMISARHRRFELLTYGSGARVHARSAALFVLGVVSVTEAVPGAGDRKRRRRFLSRLPTEEQRDGAMIVSAGKYVR